MNKGSGITSFFNSKERRKMNANESLGMLMSVGLPVAIALISLMQPIINLNRSITTLSEKINQLVEKSKNLDLRLTKHGEEINRNSDNIIKLETDFRHLQKEHEERREKRNDDR